MSSWKETIFISVCWSAGQLVCIWIFDLDSQTHISSPQVESSRFLYKFSCVSLVSFLLSYLITYLLTHSMVQSTSWEANWFAASQEIPTHFTHGTRRFSTALTSVRHLSLSWASPIQSIYPHPTSWRSILILSTHLSPGLHSGFFPSGFPIKTLYTPLSSPIRATCPAHLRHWQCN